MKLSVLLSALEAMRACIREAKKNSPQARSPLFEKQTKELKDFINQAYDRSEQDNVTTVQMCLINDSFNDKLQKLSKENL